MAKSSMSARCWMSSPSPIVPTGEQTDMLNLAANTGTFRGLIMLLNRRNATASAGRDADTTLSREERSNTDATCTAEGNHRPADQWYKNVIVSCLSRVCRTLPDSRLHAYAGFPDTGWSQCGGGDSCLMRSCASART